MPKGSKSAAALRGHRTKSEIESRRQAESNLITGSPLTESQIVHDIEFAHGEFARVSELFKNLDKNDDLYSAVVNRYCLIQAECLDFENLKKEYQNSIVELTADKESIVEDFVTEPGKDTISLAQYYKMKNNFSKTILSLDSAIMSKRKMLFDIEKENLMTVASSLRSIPKSPVLKDADNPLLKALQDDD